MMDKADRLPQLDGRLFLTDGGLETTLIFIEGIELPCFAAFGLLRSAEGRAKLKAYYQSYLRIAAADGTGFVLESPTWRASPDWAQRLGYSLPELDRLNGDAIALMRELRDAYASETMPIVISGCVGPRGDGYDPGSLMSPEEAQSYHARQIAVFRAEGVDMVTAITMTNSNEAIGVARAATAAGLPVAISFTVETDARLPTGESLDDAIIAVDSATDRAPAYYMINCAHPTHFGPALDSDEPWVKRIRGLRANASRRSHAELDNSADLDDGDPVELAAEHRELLRRHRHINVVGGCCGTDHRHVEQISAACRESASV